MVSGIVARQQTWTAAAAAKKVERKNYANTGKLKGETQLKIKERKTAFCEKKKCLLLAPPTSGVVNTTSECVFVLVVVIPGSNSVN